MFLQDLREIVSDRSRETMVSDVRTICRELCAGANRVPEQKNDCRDSLDDTDKQAPWKSLVGHIKYESDDYS
jgi:hypothetical protein